MSSGLRSRHPSGCQGPCSAGPRFDPLESDHTFEEEYAKINRDLDEEPANLHRWRAWLSMFFLVVMTGPPIAAFFLTAKEWVDPLVRVVPADDSQQVKDIFFGGTAWLISCITDKSAAKAPRVLEEAAQLLRPRGVRVARVHCWHPLDTKKGKRTLAQRFGFRAKPPVVMATTGKGSPTFLAATGLPAEALAAKVLAAVIPDAEAPKASIRDAKYLDRKGSHPSSFCFSYVISMSKHVQATLHWHSVRVLDFVGVCDLPHVLYTSVFFLYKIGGVDPSFRAPFCRDFSPSQSSVATVYYFVEKSDFGPTAAFDKASQNNECDSVEVFW